MTEWVSDPKRGELEGGVITRIASRLLRTRWLMRAPIAVFRAGWGWIFGARLVLIEHLGRTSHEPRYVVLEVVDRGRNRLCVASGFGTHSQWYRNIESNGVAFLSTGAAKRVPAAARMLDPDESAEVLRGYAQRDPVAWKVLAPVLARLSGGRDTPVIEFTPTDEWFVAHRRRNYTSTSPTS